MAENIFARKARELGNIRLDSLKNDVDQLKQSGPGEGVSDHGGLSGLSDDDHTQYLTQSRAQNLFYTKEEVDSQIGSQGTISHADNARRLGCKYITFDQHSVPNDSSGLTMGSGRLYMFKLPVREGDQITGIRLPIVDNAAGPGEVRFAVYNSANAKLSETGDVLSQLTSDAAQTWKSFALQNGPLTIENDDGVWIVSLSTAATGPRVFFNNTGAYPDWINRASGPTSLFIDNSSALPSTLDPGAGVNYRDFMIGLY